MSPVDPTPFDERGLPPGRRLRAGLEVSPAELRAMLAAPGDPPLIIDCREPDEWRICRIEGAVLVPLGEIEERREELRELVVVVDATIVVYCHHGVRSLTAATLLRGGGLRGARSLAGGIDQWSLAIDPGVRRY
jgi:rhodanese-related sulfurtransferase